MFLKYKINQNPGKQLLDVIACEVTPNNEYFILTAQTKTPHRFISDNIILKHDIKQVDKYTDAVELLTNNCDIVYVKKPQTIIEKNVKQKNIEVTYESGYYWVEGSKIVRIPDNLTHIILDKYSSFNDKLKVIIIDDCHFSINIKRYQKLSVVLTTDTEEKGYFQTSGRLPLLLHPGNEFTVRRKSFHYVYDRKAEQYDVFAEVTENPLGQTKYLGETVIFSGNIYTWTPNIELIPCTYINDYTFSYLYEKNVIFENDILEVEDNRFVSNSGALYDDILFYEYENYLNFSIPISNIIHDGLNNEYLTKDYFDERKNELITEIKDYEKMCFTPYYKNNNEIMPVNQMTFNLYLRDRSGNEDWNTSDIHGWNQFKMDSDGKFVLNDVLTNGDLLGYAGFNDDNDVYFRRKKIEKTFLRLSFYNSNDPFTQMLLYYSTIFLDSGELYTKYISNVNSIDKLPDVPLIKQSQFGDNNLTLSFNVTDRYNRHKSSEGFYLYLFPDGIKNGEKRKIYMKAEFNHAGNGKTLPLIFPHTNIPLSFKSNQFPTSLLTEDGDLSELYRQMYIPLTVEYNEEIGDYIYYFDITTYDSTKQTITMGLYEPKINPLM